jgi:hypothetical protein
MTTDLITQDRLKSLLTYDATTGYFTRIKTNTLTGRTDKTGYVRVSIGDKLCLAHRLVWLYVYGEWPADCIDHINRVRCDNRLSNLRVVSRSENQHNRSVNRNNSSGQTGVCWFSPKQKWRAYIKIRGKAKHLGWFCNFSDAVVARTNAEKQYHSGRISYADG